MQEDDLRSTRSSSRARTEGVRGGGRSSSERGFVLISALILAVLYFGLMELMLIDSQRALSEAQRFRARILAGTHAESGAELAARQMVTGGSSHPPTAFDSDGGSMTGTLTRSAENFELTGIGTSGGVVKVTSTVNVRGRIIGATVHIDSTAHQ